MTIRNFTLFGTDGCHLCEEAQMLAAAVAARMTDRFQVRTVDIAENDQLMHEYGVRIPVLRDAATGAELGWPFDEQTLESFVKALP